MMKQAFQKITAFLMAVIVLLSTVSFTVTKHYCGTMLVDVSLYKGAKACGMEMPLAKASCETKITTKSCCSDTHQRYQGQDELKVSWHDFEFGQQLFTTSFFFSVVHLHEDQVLQRVPFEDYSPLLLTQDLQVLNAIFLI